MYRNLSEFIARLEREGELQRVSVPVDPVYEIAEITDRMSKQPDGGKALLFEQTGTPFPVLTNMMGSDRRMAMALDVADIVPWKWDLRKGSILCDVNKSVHGQMLSGTNADQQLEVPSESYFAKIHKEDR